MNVRQHKVPLGLNYPQQPCVCVCDVYLERLAADYKISGGGGSQKPDSAVK